MLLQIRLEKVTIALSLDAGLEDAGALQNTCDPTAKEMDCAGWQGATVRANPLSERVRATSPTRRELKSESA